MRAVHAFNVYTNGFEGALPEGGVRSMGAVTDFAIHTNRFKGALPASGLQVMRATGMTLKARFQKPKYCYPESRCLPNFEAVS
eukprot:2643332-Amphidinium_carterae.1